MTGYRFPTVSTITEAIEVLSSYHGVFIRRPSIAEQGRLLYHEASKFFVQDTLPSLDEKTMFPTRIKSLDPDIERKVIQQYISKDWVVDDPNLRQVMDRVITDCKSLATDIISYAGEVMNHPASYVEDMLKTDEWTLNIAQYPFLPGNDGKILFPAHKDWGMLAIYPYVHGEGLERYNNLIKWKKVVIPKDCVFCYAGDILSKVTDGEIKPLLHRVVQPENQAGKSRTSIIFYADPIRSMVLPNGDKVGDIIDAKLRKIEQIK
jgi:isopenicillin N synthase-like dioxygenase